MTRWPPTDSIPADFARTQKLMDQGRRADAVGSVTDPMLELGIAGDVDDVIDQCAALIESGVRHISFGPPLGTDRMDSIRLIGRRVLPVLRAQLGS